LASRWGEEAKALIPTVPSPINAARNTSAMAPIGPDIWTPIAVAITVARISVTVARISVTVSGITTIIARVSWICVTWVTGTDIDANALGGGFERHHRQGEGDNAHT
jgi:hypothetical protein